MSITDRFRALLRMSDRALMIMIDLYNSGELSPETRLAMEAIDALNDQDK